MIRNIRFVGCILWTVTGLNSLAKGQPAAPSAEKTPQSFVVIQQGDPEDLGDTAPGTRITRSISVANTSRVGVSLQIESKTCTCVEAHFPATLAPGESGSVQISVLAVEAPTSQRHGVVFKIVPSKESTDAGQSFPVFIEYRPNVEFAFAPPMITMHAFSSVAAETLLSVRRVDGRAPQLSAVTLSEPWLRQVAASTHPQLPGVRDIRLSAQQPKPGVYTATIRVQSTTDAEPRQVADVVLRVVPDYYATPPGVVFGGQSRERRSTRVVIRPAHPNARATGPLSYEIRPNESGFRVTADSKAAPDEFGCVVSDEAADGGSATVHVDVKDTDGRLLLSIPLVRLPR